MSARRVEEISDVHHANKPMSLRRKTSESCRCRSSHDQEVHREHEEREPAIFTPIAGGMRSLRRDAIEHAEVTTKAASMPGKTSAKEILKTLPV